MPTSRSRVAVATVALLAVPVLAGSAPSCGDGDAVAHVRDVVALADDGEVDDGERRRDAVAGDGTTCTDRAALSAGDLPLAVSILHRGPDGPVEGPQVGIVDGVVTTRVAVRDRTAAERTLLVDAGEEERVQRRVGVPQLVTTSITYPSSWSRVVPEDAGARTDVIDGRLRVRHVQLLFPPVTDDEVAVAVQATPGRGTPWVEVEAAPIAAGDGVLRDGDLLDRDSAAVVGALSAAGADGVRELADGGGELADGLRELAGGTGELATGLQEAAGGVGPLRDGVDELAVGAAQLAAGIRELASGLGPLGDGARALADGQREVATGLREAAAGADEIADGNEQVAEGNERYAQLTVGLQVTAESLRAATGVLSGLIDALPEQLLGPLVEPLAEIVGEVDELAEQVAFLAGGNAELAEANRELAEGARELAAGLREAAGGVDELVAGTEDAAGGADAAAAGARELADGADQLADGARQLGGGVAEAADGLGEAAAGAGELAAGTDEAADGADALADGAGELPEALTQARDAADEAGRRLAEEDAVLRTGRHLAEERVRGLTGTEQGTASVELAAAGDEPLGLGAFVGGAAAAVAALATGLWWQRRRAGSA